MTRILVTGAGSLVGFSILESLEGRRAGVELFGISNGGGESEVARFDEFRVVPSSADPSFPAILERLIDDIAPDLVIPGRDPDIGHLAALRDRRPDLAPVVMCGGSESAELTMDKARTWAFACEYGLPWAPTLVCGPSGAAALPQFAASHPLPWVLKPAGGSASLGVLALTDPDHARWWVDRPGFVIQPLLGGARDLPEIDLSAGIPWLVDTGDPHLRSVQVVVGPDGRIVAMFCSDHVLGTGLTRASRAATDPEALRIAETWARSLAAVGWRGSLNVQMKVDPVSGPVPIEINARPSGATHGRLLLGFDEIGIALRAWTGVELPPPPRPTGSAVVYRPRAWLGEL